MTDKILERTKELITYKTMTFVLAGLLMISVVASNVTINNTHESGAQLVNAGDGKMLLALDIELNELIELGNVVEIGEIIELGKFIELGEVIELDHIINLDNIAQIDNIIDLNSIFELSEIIEVEEIIEIEDVIDLGELMDEELTTSLEGGDLGMRVEESTVLAV